MVCLSTEKLLGASWSGTSLKDGDIVYIRAENAKSGVGLLYALPEIQQVLSLGAVPGVLR